jgi:hypothetical protein
MKHTFTIINTTNNQPICEVQAKTKRGAILVFRRTFALEFNYRYVIAKGYGFFA